MNKEVRSCQNCKSDFAIESDDFDFYEKIKVPPPTWCPGCRTIRRMVFRNERTLYKRPCNLCGKETISMYDRGTPFPVYCHSCWYSDKWDPFLYARDYDFSKPFFKQFNELIEIVPRLSLLITGNNKDSDYTNIVEDMKNCYLVFEADFDEDCMYSGYLVKSKRVLDSFYGWENELCYETIYCQGCYGVKHSYGCQNCINSHFLRDCIGCQDCFGCVNLRNKSYHIFNQPYTKEDYKKKIELFNIGSRKASKELEEKFRKFSENYPRKYAYIQKSEKANGNFIFNSSDQHQCFGMNESKSAYYTIWSNYDSDISDAYASGYYAGILHECQSVFYKAYNIKFSNFCFKGISDATYCDLCTGSSNIFGCVGLKKGEYCILNKKYSREDYASLIAKIIKHMEEMPFLDKNNKTYKYGEFFPATLSPFAYNESIAQDYYPLTSEKAELEGFTWKNFPEKSHTPTIQADDLEDNISNTLESIVREIISCRHHGACNEQCTKAFKVTPSEFKFYKILNLPIPDLCPNCRHFARLNRNTPYKLWKRECQCAGQKSTNETYKNTAAHFHGDNKCPSEFETSYAPDRKEIVYCEQCYNAEVV